MAATAPAQIIDAPPLATPPNGLLNAASVVDPDDDRWLNGFTFAPESCAPARIWDPSCNTSSNIVTSVADAATTNASPTLTSITAGFNAMDVGKTITGTGIPGSTTIASVQSATSITLSANATATAAGVTITIANRLPGSTRPPNKTFYPFAVDAHDTCSAFGFTQNDYEGRARRALAASETEAVELEFWTGAQIAGNVHLADNTNTVKLASSAAQGLRTGLATLVQAIADLRLGKGMIHARPYLVTHWSGLNLLYREGGKLYTYAGNLVVPGAGYTGSAPDGTAPTATATWAYVTEAVQVRRSPIEVYASERDRQASFDRNTNTVTVRAMRMYSVVGNFCAVAGAKINPTSTS